MPNYDAPFGFKATGVGVAGAHRIVTHRRTKLASNTDQFFTGDALGADANGGLSRSITPGTTPVLGISPGNFPASTLATIGMLPVEGMLFLVQSNGDFQRTHVNQNANLALGTGNANTKTSADVLNISTVATTNTLDLKINVAADNRENVFGNYGIAIVSFNRAGIGSLIVGV